MTPLACARPGGEVRARAGAGIRRGDRVRGFTVIELLVVLAAMALLLAIAAPRYVQHVDHARDVALRQDLQVMRDAIDKFQSDKGRAPANLDELAAAGYLREVPPDPLTGRRDSWQTTPAAPEGGAAGIVDVHSGATGRSSDGTDYASW